MSAPSAEPPDHHVYNWVSFNSDTFEFFRVAVGFYEALLRADVEAIRADKDLRAILDDETLESYPISQELKRVERVLEWFARYTAQGSKAFGYDVNIAHGMVRFLKSVAALYFEHLRLRRQDIAARPTTSKALLGTLDQHLARLEEKTQLGIFRSATPYPLALDQLPALADTPGPADAPRVDLPKPIRPRPVILGTIEISDPLLRSRCLDLFALFREDGQLDRLDTVVAEATKILEDRIRSLCSAPATIVGVDLARLAFCPPNAQLIVSDIAPEQDAAHLLYRGVFGFLRNSAGHRLLGPLQPERVLQIVGMVDYLISVAEAASRKPPNC